MPMTFHWFWAGLDLEPLVYLKQLLQTMCVIVPSVFLLGGCLTVEHVPYEVLHKDDHFELRAYEAYIVAETLVQATQQEAGNIAFQRLYGYISGKNRSQDKIAMTAPVTQQPASEKIAMTAPVGQQRADDGWVVSFVMPASYTLETLPQPEDPLVTLREVPAGNVAAVRYSGTWSVRRYEKQLQALEDWINTRGLTIRGDPQWARYNSPFTLWFLRRNEVLIPVE